jgi:hypothetical protein
VGCGRSEFNDPVPPLADDRIAAYYDRADRYFSGVGGFARQRESLFHERSVNGRHILIR